MIKKFDYKIIFILVIFFLYLGEYLLYKEYIYKEIDNSKLSSIENIIKYHKTPEYLLLNAFIKSDELTPIQRPYKHFKKNLEIYPLAGVSNKKTILCRNAHKTIFYESDKYGFNNPNFVWDNQEIKNVVIGSNFAHGACVERKNNITSKLSLLQNSIHLNLSYGKYGPLIKLAALREYSGQFKIENILWFTSIDSLTTDLNGELKSVILNKYLNEAKFSQNLKEKQKEIDNFVAKSIEKETEDHMATYIENLKEQNLNYRNRFLKLHTLRRYILDLNFLNKDNNKTREIVINKNFTKTLKQVTNLPWLKESNIYIIFSPTYEDFENETYNDYSVLLKKISKKNNFNFIDLKKKIEEKEINYLKLFNPPESIYKSIHNEIGHKVIAEIINENILN